MLHLLDPQVYPLDSLDTFKKRVKLRQEIAERMMDLNLQNLRASAIHYDLPFSTNRIEQRMGRLDRFGSGMPVHSAVLVCDGLNVQKRWFEFVDAALGVFNRSIASLQYVIESLWSEILESGAEAVAEATWRIGWKAY